MLLAGIKACEAFRRFHLSRHFTVRSEHKELAANFNTARSVSSRVTKWLLAWLPFDFAIEVRGLTENMVADSLSRIPWPVRLPSLDASQDFVELLDADSESAAKLEVSLPSPFWQSKASATRSSGNRHCSVAGMTRDGNASEAK